MLYCYADIIIFALYNTVIFYANNVPYSISHEVYKLLKIWFHKKTYWLVINILSMYIGMNWYLIIFIVIYEQRSFNRVYSLFRS